MMRRVLVVLGIMVMALVGYGLVMAHANLQRAEPPPNSILDSAPAEIRLWFTEPLEPQFSKINLRDSDGNILNTPPSQIDPNDSQQMVLVPGDLPRGLYTVVWRALSSADGHPSTGSYPLVIGDASLLSGTTNETIDIVPASGAFIRWFNLFSLALGVGGLSFLLFVWKPAAPDGHPVVESYLEVGTWVGWLLIGVSGFLLLLLQYSLATGNPLLVDINGDSLNGVVANTRFGHLWLARMALWAGMGGALWFARSDKWFQPVALVIGGAILAISSVFSHANAAYDVTASVAADWLHLTAMALWVGGLIHFVVVIGAVRMVYKPAASILSALVGRFTNFARVSVAVLIITGLYSTWLQVGSLDALLNTTYGQALLIKLILIVPVLGIAFVNMRFTQHALKAGNESWGRRLRGLVGAEVVLTLGMLAAVGVMTYTIPARNNMALRAANPPAPEPLPIKDVQTVNGMVIETTISPGWVGENTFTLKLVDENGAPVNDADLIRMKFDSQSANLGQSELRPVLTAEGVYSVSGANLSVGGEWRIRTTIRRPNVFDTLVDINPTVPAAPPFPRRSDCPIPATAAQPRTGTHCGRRGGAGRWWIFSGRKQNSHAASLVTAGIGFTDAGRIIFVQCSAECGDS
ncbi:MAG: copper resistance protein CopC [Anaerolineae bacterium]